MNFLIQIISGLSDELSSGALDFASKTIDQFLKILFKDVQPNSDILLIFVSKIIDHIDDPEPMLRKEVTFFYHIFNNSS
jgi:hypothetical protein